MILALPQECLVFVQKSTRFFGIQRLIHIKSMVYSWPGLVFGAFILLSVISFYCVVKPEGEEL